MTGYPIQGRGAELVESALQWLDRGCSVVPAQPRSKAVVMRWGEYKDRRTTRDQVISWFGSGVMNLALVCGTGGIEVLDFDDLPAYHAWLSKAGSLADTYGELTGRGVHLFYRIDKPETRSDGQIECFGPGHLVNLAPSIHPSGTVYKPLNNRGVLQVTASELFSLLSDKSAGQHVSRSGIRAPEPLSKVSGDTVSRIKAFYSVAGLAEKLTTFQHVYRGRWMVGRCPFHEDKEPSFWVDMERGIYGCYSPSCEAHRGGDVINLYALANKQTIGQAIRELARGLPPGDRLPAGSGGSAGVLAIGRGR